MSGKQKSPSPSAPTSATSTPTTNSSTTWAKWNNNTSRKDSNLNTPSYIDSIDPLTSHPPDIRASPQNFECTASESNTKDIPPNQEEIDSLENQKTVTAPVEELELGDAKEVSSSSWWFWGAKKPADVTSKVQDAASASAQTSMLTSTIDIPQVKVTDESTQDSNSNQIDSMVQGGSTSHVDKSNSMNAAGSTPIVSQETSEQVAPSRNDIAESTELLQNTDIPETWPTLFNTYRRVSSVITYMYRPTTPAAMIKQDHDEQAATTIMDNTNSQVEHLERDKLVSSTEQNVSSTEQNVSSQEAEVDTSKAPTPIISKAPTPANNQDPIQLTQPQPISHTSWVPSLSWFWTSNNEQSEHKSDPSSIKDIYQSAKKFIESSTDAVSYAIKSSRSNKTFGDLAVYGTASGDNPVRITGGIPITTHELQELSMSSNANSNLAPAALSTTLDGSAQSSNVTIPDFDATFRSITLRTRTRIISEHLIFNQTKNNERHLYKISESEYARQKIMMKNVIIIGVHGFYPFKMTKTLINQYSKNAITLTNEASKAVRKWGTGKGMDLRIETIALEGYGTVFNRVQSCLSLLQNWMTLIRNCDFLFVVSHSQSVPVSIELLAKLITDSVLDDVQKVGLLAMNGAFLGPYTGLESKLVARSYSFIENEIINETFQLQNSDSQQSQKLSESLSKIVDFNVKVTICGSIDDQFIPLYSSLAVNLNHPNILRCVYSSENYVLPEFLKKLFNLLALMRNLGYSDNNMIQELSKYFQGLPISGGHCDIIKEQRVYLTAIANSLETTDLFKSRDIDRTIVHSKDINVNSYHLPWCIRGVFNDLRRVKNVDKIGLMKELVGSFQNWNPTQKQLKELKYCINAIENLDPDELLL